MVIVGLIKSLVAKVTQPISLKHNVVIILRTTFSTYLMNFINAIPAAAKKDNRSFLEDRKSKTAYC